MALFSNILTKFFGRKSDKDLKKILPIVDEINLHFDSLNQLSDEEIKNRFLEIKHQLQEKISVEKEMLILSLIHI